jgi:hypothetical protein
MADEDDAAPTNKSDADFPFVQLAYDVKSAEISPHPSQSLCRFLRFADFAEQFSGAQGVC